MLGQSWFIYLFKEKYDMTSVKQLFYFIRCYLEEEVVVSFLSLWLL